VSAADAGDLSVLPVPAAVVEHVAECIAAVRDLGKQTNLRLLLGRQIGDASDGVLWCEHCGAVQYLRDRRILAASTPPGEPPGEAIWIPTEVGEWAAKVQR
jgi:hypothetical protein